MFVVFVFVCVRACVRACVCVCVCDEMSVFLCLCMRSKEMGRHKLLLYYITFLIAPQYIFCGSFNLSYGSSRHFLWPLYTILMALPYISYVSPSFSYGTFIPYIWLLHTFPVAGLYLLLHSFIILFYSCPTDYSRVFRVFLIIV